MRLLDEADADATDLDRPEGTIGDDLELLRCLVGRSVEGGGGEKAHVVGTPEVVHQIADEPGRRKGRGDPILRRHDHVEPAAGRRHAASPRQPPERVLERDVREAERLGRFHAGERVPPGGLEAVEEARKALRGSPRQRSWRVAVFATFPN